MQVLINNTYQHKQGKTANIVEEILVNFSKGGKKRNEK